MKCSKAQIQCKTRQIHVLKFEDQSLTSFSGLIVFQRLFDRLGLKERLRQCFRHLKVGSIYGYHRIALLLVIHLLLGYRELRDVRYYRDDPMVKRVCGLKRLPDVATISRALAAAGDHSVGRLRQLLGELAPYPPDLGLRRLGTKHHAFRRGHGRGIQQEKERSKKLLSAHLYHCPDRDGPGALMALEDIGDYGQRGR